uniref:Copper type II ascorbate-dependent monooxygenase C-terminal domain-containing protein n=1 Tax=Chromera velia CCMP2878 TaxID=1169474 RepID=A0A0G4F0X6_9ALVE|mmetsp:Transcript_24498/g.48019  ORF Transcript_24498/g.48019 Transcript_24498/m.48019 type:complete len:496 (-) Transcript_24498:556-2043(-)|eukprot:Cvel_14410.t1-p1 / transcript=Cvel_14410.t1 / gene=Cvel_14410 / organism=Chromera_velia_CCMP2878 / gene_product=DBH-like monooxygenase protein 1, putative / transcript_product=DBH-like monooxygenase protein 1, putative / location=Cvel_scaffold1024:25279-26763(-) / protein_length=495 / sequence_SO=supercontig / SO=protein_coding / is_pseudo=false
MRRFSVLAAGFISVASASVSSSSSGVSSSPPPSFVKNFFVEDRLVADANNTEGIMVDDAEGEQSHAGFSCRIFHQQEDATITGFTPVLNSTDGVDIVHHMNIFACTEGILEFTKGNTVNNGQECASNFAFPGWHCRNIVVTYDKGAQQFTLPPTMGTRVGPQSGFPYLMLSLHYLVPKGSFDTRPNGYHDSSGFSVQLSNSPPVFNVGIWGMLDHSLSIPKQTDQFRFQFQLHPWEVAEVFGTEFATFGKVTTFAAHLHAHDTATSLHAEVFRPVDGSRQPRGPPEEALDEWNSTTIYKMEPYGGYGPAQSFHYLPTPVDFFPGDLLRLTCDYNSTHKDADIPYGVRHDEEMCACLFWFGPTGVTGLPLMRPADRRHSVRTDQEERPRWAPPGWRHRVAAPKAEETTEQPVEDPDAALAAWDEAVRMSLSSDAVVLRQGEGGGESESAKEELKNRIEALGVVPREITEETAQNPSLVECRVVSGDLGGKGEVLIA